MNEYHFDQLLAVSRPLPINTNTEFTNAVISRIKLSGCATVSSSDKKKALAPRFIRSLWQHKIPAILVLLIIAVTLGFTGYSYAIGSNPISVLKRWVVGDAVHVQYKHKTYVYGAQRSYSDAAVTAYAELQTTYQLFSDGSNSYTIPKNGVQHFLAPMDYTAYQYPWLGTIIAVNNNGVTLHKQFITGDKMSPTQSVDEQVTLSLEQYSLYIEGRDDTTSQAKIGAAVIVYEHSYYDHTIGSTDEPPTTAHYFVFQLNHSLNDAITASQLPTNFSDLSQSPIREEVERDGFSNLINLCLNNGGDTCFHLPRQGDGAQGLYGNIIDPDTGKDYGIKSNPAVNYFQRGSVDPTNTGTMSSLLMRNTEGKLVKITPSDITIKSSSGTLWTFAYDESLQRTFASTFGPLKVGDGINVSMLSPLTDLDAHDFPTAQIYSMSRYSKS